MITLLGSLLGFITSAIPQLLGLWKDYQDRKHEAEIFERQLRWAEVSHGYKMEEMQVSSDAAEIVAIHKEAAEKSGVPWSDALRGSVRPVITYLFIALFIAIKWCALSRFLDATGGDWVVSLPYIWDEETQGIFAAIISFWFGHRAFERSNRRR